VLIHSSNVLSHPSTYPYLLVIVEHSVHVLNPNGIHRAVKHDPLAVGALIRSGDAVVDSKDPVTPFVAHRIKLAIQLPHCDALGVHAVYTHFVLVILPCILELAQGRSEGAVAASFGTVGQSHNHQPVPHHYHFVQLNGLLAEVCSGLEICVFAPALQFFKHVDVVGRGQNSGRKQILGDALKKRQIVREKLCEKSSNVSVLLSFLYHITIALTFEKLTWHVDVTDGAEHQDVFWRIFERLFQVASCSQHRHHSTHAIVIVSLG
jgi:hypothetical protein